MTLDYIEKIRQANVYDVAIKTPLEHAPILSGRLNNRVLHKREDLQPVFSFKLRGAYNKLAALSEAERGRGVIAASAGNHAQGVALAGRRLRIQTLIVMPKTTPQIKVDAVRRLGGEVILHGNAYDDAYEHAAQLATERGLTFIHPYDDPDVIAGQGTIAMELLEQHPEPVHAVFVPVGGGGLIAGVAAYLKAMAPDTRVIGVEPDDAGSFHAALAAGERVELEQVGIFADGVAVRKAGETPFAVAQHLVDEVILVSGDEVCAAIKDIFDDTRSIAEPAGALAVAGLKKYVAREGIEQQSLIAIDSGANVNFDRLRYVAERADIGEQREALFGVTIPEEPGSFKKFCHTLGTRSITEFNYRYSGPQQAYVYTGVELREGLADKERLVQHLNEKGFELIDLSDDEVAKLHIRYMVGGRYPGLDNELLYRFEFPERPGALMHFLSKLDPKWNISLFHYRNHGADFGRVLVGIQVDDAELQDLTESLEQIGYPYWNESDNPAYRMFLL